MADFLATIYSGAYLVAWTDPAVGTTPSRINPRPGHPHLRWVATVGTPVVVHAIVAGLGEAPLDSALGGRLFSAAVAEHPGWVSPISGTSSKSSEQTYTPMLAGHYALELTRTTGGTVILHFDAQ